MPQVQRKAQLPSHVWRGMLQRAQSHLVLVFVTLDGHVNAGIVKIVGDPNFGYRNHRQTGIFQFVTDDLRDLFAQRFSDALRPMHEKQ
jgi:hypothetical protein